MATEHITENICAAPSAQIIPLPGAATAPVLQQRRAGRHPKKVICMRRFLRLRSESPAVKEVETAKQFVETAEYVLNAARHALSVAREKV